MNVQIRYNANVFNEVHPVSEKDMPLIEEIPCQAFSSADSFRMNLRWKEENQKLGVTAPLLDRLKKYLCKPGQTAKFKGRWLNEQTGRDPKTNEIIYGALLFVFEADDARLELRMQSPHDKYRANFCPEDQIRPFIGSWKTETEFEFRLVAGPVRETTPLDDEIARLSAMDTEDLQTLAAPAGVDWDPKASRETMVQTIAAARVAKRASKGAPPAPVEKKSETKTTGKADAAKKPLEGAPTV